MPTSLSLPERTTLANPQSSPNFYRAVSGALGTVCVKITQLIRLGTIDINDNSARLAAAVLNDGNDQIARTLTRLMAMGWDEVLGNLTYDAVYPPEHETLAGELIPVLQQVEEQVSEFSSPTSSLLLSAIAQQLPAYSLLWLKLQGQEPDATVTHVDAIPLT